MSQRSFASAEYAMKKKRTRREKFLGEMERIVPWARLIAVIEPLYPKSGRVGRQPIGVPKMLRMYCLQQWYGLADEALEDALYDSQPTPQAWSSAAACAFAVVEPLRPATAASSAQRVRARTSQSPGQSGSACPVKGRPVRTPTKQTAADDQPPIAARNRCRMGWPVRLAMTNAPKDASAQNERR